MANDVITAKANYSRDGKMSQIRVTVSDQISALTFLSPSDSCDISKPPENDSSLSEVLERSILSGDYISMSSFEQAKRLRTRKPLKVMPMVTSQSKCHFDRSCNQSVITSIFTVKILFRIQKKKKVC